MTQFTTRANVKIHKSKHRQTHTHTPHTPPTLVFCVFLKPSPWPWCEFLVGAQKPQPTVGCSVSAPALEWQASLHASAGNYIRTSGARSRPPHACLETQRPESIQSAWSAFLGPGWPPHPSEGAATQTCPPTLQTWVLSVPMHRLRLEVKDDCPSPGGQRGNLYMWDREMQGEHLWMPVSQNEFHTLRTRFHG